MSSFCRSNENLSLKVPKNCLIFKFKRILKEILRSTNTSHTVCKQRYMFQNAVSNPKKYKNIFKEKMLKSLKLLAIFLQYSLQSKKKYVSCTSRSIDINHMFFYLNILDFITFALWFIYNNASACILFNA